MTDPERRPRRRKRLVAGALAVAVVAGGVGVWRIDGLNWRARVIGLKTVGSLPDLPWPDLLRMIGPGSRHYLAPLVDARNPYRVIHNPYRSPEDAVQGERLFRSHCAACHGAQHGASAVDLFAGGLRRGDSDWALFRTIREGVPDSAMPAFELPETDLWQIVAHIRTSVEKAALDAGTATDSTDTDRPQTKPVSFADLLNAPHDASGWLMYSGAYDGRRHSPASEITPANVSRLRPRWIVQLGTTEQVVETTPLVAGGVMYLTEPPSNVLALDVRTGATLWTYRRNLPGGIMVCCGRVNRGVAILHDKVFLETLDAHLVALDAVTGRVIWDVEVADHREGYSATAAPLAVKDKIIVGIAGGEYGIRGFVDAYLADSGRRAWRLYTIPAAGEPGADTWSGDSWRTGGAPTWMTGSYDPDANLLYWGIGNPSPNYSGDTRRGDNLFSNSVAAIDADTGELRWHFQFTPHDLYDWDANQVPVLVDRSVGGEQRKLLLSANKNGFFYALDRLSGQFLRARAMVRQTWAVDIGPTGRPIERPDVQPSVKGVTVYPGPGGGANWWPPAYNPAAGLMYVPVLDQGATFFKGENLAAPGAMILGGASEPLRAERHWHALAAIVPETGEAAWQLRLPKRRGLVGLGGALSTAGGLVFWGDGMDFMALDAATGRELWRYATGGVILAAPISFVHDDVQHIVVAAGRSVIAFAVE